MKPGTNRPDRSFTWLLPLLYLALAAILWLVLGRANEADANFVAYRFAANLMAGRGLVYWTSGTPGLVVSTYPLVPALLTLLPLAGIPLPVAGGILSIGAATIGAICLARLCDDGGAPWVAGAAYLLVVMVQPSPVVLTMLAVALAGLDAARRAAWTRAGLWIGFAILAEPSAMVLAVLTLIYVIRLNGSIRRYLLPVTISLGVMLAMMRLSHAPLISVVPGLVTALLPLAAILVLIRRWRALRESPPRAVLFAWSAITVLAALVGGRLPAATVVPGLIAVTSLLPVPALVLAAACADMLIGFLLAGQFTAPASSQALGEWIAAHTKPGAALAAADTGALAYYADRPVIDLGGRIQPDAAPHGLDQAFFMRYAPDVVVLPDDLAVRWQGFDTTYSRMQAVGSRPVYQPVVNFSPLDDHDADVNYGISAVGRDDLRLTGLGLDSVLHPGDLVRVRLNWQLTYAPPVDIRITLALLDGQGGHVAGVSDLVPAAAWQVGTMSTYHLLAMPGKVASGNVSLHLTVALGGATSPDSSVATVSVAQ